MNNLARWLFAVLLCTAPSVLFAQPRNATRPAPPIANPQKEILTNAAIIELSQPGLGEAVITEKIRQSECSFDTSISGLKQLKAAKVSDTLIALMMNPNAKPAPQPALAPAPAAVAKPVAISTPPVPATNNSAVRDSAGKPIPMPADKGA